MPDVALISYISSNRHIFRSQQGVRRGDFPVSIHIDDSAIRHRGDTVTAVPTTDGEIPRTDPAYRRKRW